MRKRWCCRLPRRDPVIARWCHRSATTPGSRRSVLVTGGPRQAGPGSGFTRCVTSSRSPGSAGCGARPTSLEGYQGGGMGSFCAHLLDIWVPVWCMPHLALGSRRGKAPSRYEAFVMFVLAPTLQWATPKVNGWGRGHRAQGSHCCGRTSSWAGFRG